MAGFLNEMTFQPNDDLQRAKAELTVLRLWEFAALPTPREGRDGKYFSPFRDEKTPSFSISREGRVWCDFGGTGKTKGGVWEFAEKVWPNADPGEIAAKLIEASGIVPTPRMQETQAAAGAPPGQVVDPALKRAAADLERKRRLREAEERPYQEREKRLERPEAKPAIPWPHFVRDRFVDGLNFLRTNPKKVHELARDRGWPTAWAQELVELELVSYVLERRFDGSEQFARRQKAFRVDAPIIKGAAAALDPIGYHQRFFIPARGNEPAQKKWMFVPSVAKFTPQSAFERALDEFGALHQSVRPSPAPLTPPLPFVLGDLNAPRVIVLLEGQWDAITFFGACGYFEDSSPPSGIAVFGIRGAQGIDPFLAHWWPWLARAEPLCWVIADNDPAGSAWRDAPPAERGKIQMPSFADRLKAAGCRDVLVSWLTRGPWGKDFNDYFKARAAAGSPPGPQQMQTWMRRVGVLTESGRFA